MWQKSDFTRLPFHFDVARLQREASQFDESDWVTHPSGFAGNAALMLVAAHGEVNDDFAISGPVAPTRYLVCCPYIRQALTALKVPINRTRLMRLGPGNNVPEHSDANYHWWRRLRIHIPITTRPEVTFRCGKSTVHMGAGECWTFNNDKLHAVENPTAFTRIHLVADTVGSDEILRQISGQESTRPVARVGFRDEKDVWPRLEPYAFEVIAPRDMSKLLRDISAQAARAVAPDGARLRIESHLQEFASRWQLAFEEFGHSRSGELVYGGLIEGFLSGFPAAFRRGFQAPSSAWRALSVIGTMFRESNRATPLVSIEKQSADVAETPEQRPTIHSDAVYRTTSRGRAQLRDPLHGCEQTHSLADDTRRLLRDFSTPSPLQPAAVKATDKDLLCSLVGQRLIAEELVELPSFDRPIFIVASPRSGSSLLFETLQRFSEVWTIGRESHDIIEGLETLRPPEGGSNELNARHASATVERHLRRRFVMLMQQHGGPRFVDLSPGSRPREVRFLEKTPKNSLRIPFLKESWPTAIFIYLYREPRQSIASIIRAWRSGGFVTYRNLKGWSGRRWSLLLPPSWQRVDRMPLPEVAALQWRSANLAIMNSLDELPREDWMALTYTDLVRDPGASIRRICELANLRCRASFSREHTKPLPLSMHTISAPSPTSWRREQAAIRTARPGASRCRGQVLGIDEVSAVFVLAVRVDCDDAAMLSRKIRELQNLIHQRRPIFVHVPVQQGSRWETSIVLTSSDACTAFVADAQAVVGATELVSRVYDGVAVEEIERPVFIISAPRSGSTLLFETLAKGSNSWTIGAESFHIVDNIPALRLDQRGYTSDALDSDDATGSAARAVRVGFGSGQRDRDGDFMYSATDLSTPGSAVFVEKTPRNCVRIPFLKSVFPEARFVFLFRDPKAVISSMMEIWLGCQRRGFWNKRLPGWGAGECWPAEHWHGLLPPGWENLRTQRLVEVILFKWKAAHEAMMAGARWLDPDDWTTVKFERLLAEPRTEGRRILDFAGIDLDREMRELLDAPLPHSASTTTAPDPDKWKRHAESIADIAADIAEVSDEILSVFGPVV